MGNSLPHGACVCAPVALSMTTSWKKSWFSPDTNAGVYVAIAEFSVGPIVSHRRVGSSPDRS